MHRDPYDYGFGSVWHDAHVDCREGCTTSVTGYHTHDFYEINLILSGSVRILTLPDTDAAICRRTIREIASETNSFRRRLITDCRLKHAVRLLRAGHTLEAAAPLCGFADASGLIRAFRRRRGMPPGAFLAGMENKQSAP